MSQDTPSEQIDKMDKPLPIWLILPFSVYIFIIFGLFLFPVSKWTWNWWEAWVVLCIMSIITTVGYLLINQKNPRVLRNRFKIRKQGLTKETKSSAGSDWFIFPLLTIGLFGSLAFPAVEKRFEGFWGQYPFPIPWWIEIIGMVVMTSGWIIMIVAQIQNAYASKILDINKDQKLIDTGLYSKVRHPLYSGFCFWIIGLPLSLGSVVALAGSITAILTLIIRIKFEEDMLISGMEGYEEYRQRVKYKLIPGIY
ncbi:MAG: isoprenylcysteine carboxylmethyltransferase family protein [Candidatus Heimdallarchaeota archaeon]|nr:MAG: isoprenylcysteine carboxylmethyltransferase family protein [Candidatus Heimdallarchaeota archaeon]